LQIVIPSRQSHRLVSKGLAHWPVRAIPCSPALP